jgi:glycosyl transferase family 87
VTRSIPDSHPWSISLARWLTLRRVRAHAAILAVCLWGVCAVDFATPGLFDRAGNIKFQDFLPIYVSAQLVARHRAADLYDPRVMESAMRTIVGEPTRVRLTYVYGPQVALAFVPLAFLSFTAAARIWVTFSVILYFACVLAIWRTCPKLRSHRSLVILSALGFPPLYHCLVRGQLSALLLACLTAAFLALRAERSWLAGIALGFLVLKPTFLVAIPIILLLARAWRIFGGLFLSAITQLAVTSWYFGPAGMHSYSNFLLQPSRWQNQAELGLAPILMHSLRSFWTLLIPSASIAFALYVLTSIAVVAITSVIWRSPSPLALRFSALTLAAVLVNPHLFVYDLLVLGPAFLLVIDWALANRQHPSSPVIRVLSYLAFVLILLGPVSRWTHLQLSVVVLALMLWAIYRSATLNHKLALTEAGVI